MKIKGFDKDLKCRGMQFEVGKTYDTGAPDGGLKLCSGAVFHFGDSLQMVHPYYSCQNEQNRFCEIEVLGAEVSDGKKYGSNRIKILREITGEELERLKGKINGNTGLFNSGKQNSGDWNSGHYNSGDRNSGHWNSGHYNSGDRNSGHWNSGDYNSGDCNSGKQNSGHYNSGDRNSGHWNSGDWNSCNDSSGVFCNQEDKNIRIFNKASGMSLEEWRSSRYYKALQSAPFYLTEWIAYSLEEQDTPEKKAAGGYLRTYSYKEACQNWWKRLSKESRQIIRQIPNFDPEVFLDITGIDVEAGQDENT